MRILTLAAGVCAAALIPTAVLAQQTCEERQNNRVAGAVVGAGLGALAGNAVAGKGDRTEGTVIGGVLGAVLGNQIAKGKPDCTRAYGYYDNNGAWHANAVAANAAAGYYDRNGAWVDGAPRGYYGNDGRWVQASTDASASGYYDARGLWVPASANGYYANDGRFIAAAAPGYYDRSGRWIAGSTTGRYNSDGQWITGQAGGRRDANGVWIADAQPGYYDNGRWVRGEAVGYYDARGRWVSTDARSNRADNNNYNNNGAWASLSVDQRQAQLAQRINRAMENGRMTRREGQQAMRSLAMIEREERSLLNRQGQLGPRGQATINAKLDRLSATVREDIRNDRYGSR